MEGPLSWLPRESESAASSAGSPPPSPPLSRSFHFVLDASQRELRWASKREDADSPSASRWPLPSVDGAYLVSADDAPGAGAGAAAAAASWAVRLRGAAARRDGEVVVLRAASRATARQWVDAVNRALARSPPSGSAAGGTREVPPPSPVNVPVTVPVVPPSPASTSTPAPTSTPTPTPTQQPPTPPKQPPPTPTKQPQPRTTTGPLLLLLLSIATHCVTVPFTKVEESFNVQATHDVLRWPHALWNESVVRENFDHVSFPGVVPRTFWGPLLLAVGATPAISVARVVAPAAFEDDLVAELVLVRLTLGVLVWVAFASFARAVEKAVSPAAARWMTLLSAVQFHLPFYASRTLPNTFALVGVLFAYAALVRNRHLVAIAWLVATTVVFRCDILVLLAPVAVWVWLVDAPSLTLPALLRRGFAMAFTALASAVVSLGLSILLDSRLWLDGATTWRWPEGEVLWFNVVENKSSAWGVSPWHWYATSALPRSLAAGAALLPFGVVGALSNFQKDARIVGRVVVPATVFVALYSVLPHKELRFVFPALPALNLASGVGAAWLSEAFPRLGKVPPALALVACVLSTTMFWSAARLNYPGGHALAALHSAVAPPPARGLSVHVDVYSAMSGVSRFGYSPRFAYSKDESSTLDRSAFDVLLTRDAHVDGFTPVHAEAGEPRVAWSALRDGRFNDVLETRGAVFVHKRSSPRPGTAEEHKHKGGGWLWS